MKIPISKPYIDQKSKDLVRECMECGQISSQGSFVSQFEREFAEWVGAESSVAVFNGTVALHLALAGLDIKAGDEVIVPDLTFAATINAVLYTGATPVLADVCDKALVLNAEKCERYINQKTRAILPVHLYGQVSDFEPLQMLIGNRPIVVVEDCAEAHGAEHSHGKKVGAAGIMGCFSFFANKVMSTGEGGMVTVNDKSRLQKMRVLRDHGMNRRFGYWHEEVGFNYRMTNLQAAIGLGQLSLVDSFITKRNQVGEKYRLGTEGLLITWPIPQRGTRSITWLSTMLVENISVRDALLSYLKDNGVDARTGFTPLSKMPPYQQFYNDGLTNSYNLSDRLISLPTYFEMSDEDIYYVITKIRSFYGK